MGAIAYTVQILLQPRVVDLKQLACGSRTRSRENRSKDDGR